MSELLLHAEGIDKSYLSGERQLHVLRQLDLKLESRQRVAIVGDSGVGKSTLLQLLGGIDQPDAGTIRFNGQPLDLGERRAMATYRNRDVGFVFQFHHLLPEFTALENVEMPFRIAGSLDAMRGQAAELLDRLGLGDRLEHLPGQLSGGEQQRVAIARAVVAKPALVLADEPTGNLDPGTGDRVFALLREFQDERGFTLLLATHSGRLASSCDRLLRLVDGALTELDQSAQQRFFGADVSQ